VWRLFTSMPVWCCGVAVSKSNTECSESHETPQTWIWIWYIIIFFLYTYIYITWGCLTNWGSPVVLYGSHCKLSWPHPGPNSGSRENWGSSYMLGSFIWSPTCGSKRFALIARLMG
jgi:hypothetical protein